MSSAQPSPIPQGQYQPPARMPDYKDMSATDQAYKGMTPGQALGGGLALPQPGLGDVVDEAFSRGPKFDVLEFFRNQGMQPPGQGPNQDFIRPHVIDTAAEERIRREFEESQRRQPPQGPSLGDTMAQPVDMSGIRDNRYTPPNPNQSGMTPGQALGGGLALPGGPMPIFDMLDQGGLFNYQSRLASGEDPNVVNQDYAKSGYQIGGMTPGQALGGGLAFPDVIGRTLPIELTDHGPGTTHSIQPETGGPGAPMPMPALQPMPMPVSRPAPQPTQPIRPNRIQNRLRVGTPQARPAPVPQPTKPVAPRRNRFRMRGF